MTESLSSKLPVDDAGAPSASGSGASPEAPRDASGTIAVRVEAGVADLSNAILLRGTAHGLFHRHGAALTRDAVAAELASLGAASAEQASADAARFLEALEGAGLWSATAPPPEFVSVPTDARRSADDGATGVARPNLEADDVERLAREILRRGLRLRYRALGRSMRPTIPHGSTLEVEARPFASIGRGQVVLYSTDEARLVAHRVVGRRGGRLVMRGDTCARLDEVSEYEYLGLVGATFAPDGTRAPVSSGWRRATGLVRGLAWRCAALLARVTLVRPLRATHDRPSVVRGTLWNTLRAVSGVALQVERRARRLRGRSDVVRAALLSAREKDERRRRLYELRTVQSFTSLDENVRAGLTLIEEALFARHSALLGPPGRALVLGCGPGRECMALADMGYRVTGTDREEGMLERARVLADERRLSIRYEVGEATRPDVERGAFDTVVIFSGLYNMVLPRGERVAMLRAAREQLKPRGFLLLTFLSAYVAPESAEAELPPPAGGVLQAINPEHQAGDLFLLNEAVHIFPHSSALEDEARDAGFDVAVLERDQRAYDREHSQVRGFAILRSSAR